MPSVVVRKIVADDADFRLFMGRPVVSGGWRAIERKPSGCDDVDEIIGNRPTLRVEQKVTLEEGSPEYDQITQKERKPDETDRARW